MFDLSGGTFNVSLLTIVKATAGDTHFGGDDFDNRLVNRCAQEFKHKNRKTSSTLEPIEKVLRDSKINKSSAREIVLIIDSLRMNHIVKLVSDFFNGQNTNRNINSATLLPTVLLSRPIFSGNTFEKTQDLLLLDVAPLSLGIDTAGGVMIVMTTLIKRNTCSGVLIQVYEGERVRMKANDLLGKFELSGIPTRTPRSLSTSTPTAKKYKGAPGRGRCCAHNVQEHLELYAYNLRNSLNEKLAELLASKLESAVNDTIKWLDVSQAKFGSSVPSVAV
ncbi:Hsp70 protein-domain-containing protein [Mycena rebaudengoi]|nr:Hsp70 protein-domain-containing protein [Mycena rebaudengoi]